MSNEHVNQAFRGILGAICPPAEKPVAPCGVEVSDDQTSVLDPRPLEFVEGVCENEQWRTCSKCVAIANNDLCDRLPCRWHTRKDGRTGYWREEVRG
jgi:hypothetical protein